MDHENSHKKRLLLSDEERKKLNDLQKHIGDKLRAKREEKGFDIHSVAKEVRISKGTLSKIERGVYHYNIDMMRRLAAYFGMQDEILPPPLNM